MGPSVDIVPSPLRISGTAAFKGTHPAATAFFLSLINIMTREMKGT